MMATETRDLLLEIGTEEIPARMLPGGSADLVALVEGALTAAGLSFTATEPFATPRRLAVLVRGIPVAQADREEVSFGPPVAAAFGPDGQPTGAALGFARKMGVDVSALKPMTSPKGSVVGFVRAVAGRATIDVLAETLPATLAKLTFPKAMRWCTDTGPFVRPVHWVCCLFGADVVPFEFTGIATGRATRGHRFLAPEPVDLATPDAYAATLRGRFVLPTPDERKATVDEAMRAAEARLGCRFLKTDALVAEISNIVEYPVFEIGQCEEDFLRLPREVLVTAMGAHLRFFASEKPDGTLAATFGVVSNTKARDMAVVVRGNERVLAARLYDARFFWEVDRKSGLPAMAARLGERLFLKGAGDMAEKSARIVRIVDAICDQAGIDDATRAEAKRAAALCKADLMSNMVGEFPELQGVMGMYYARAGGETEGVATAIREHYLPRFAGDDLPGTLAGALVAVADRVDSIATCFRVGAIPTGSKDPLALRRQAIGLLKILAQRAWNGVTVHSLVGDQAPAIQAQILDFVRERFHGILTSEYDVPADFANAVLQNVGEAMKPIDQIAMAVALRDFAATTDGFRDFLDNVFKRVLNILKQADEKLPGWRDEVHAAGDLLVVEDDLSRTLAADCELAVEAARKAAIGIYRKARAEGAYSELLGALYTFKDPLARFFGSGKDGVPVLIEEDARKRLARLAVLLRVFALFGWFADFSKISTR